MYLADLLTVAPHRPSFGQRLPGHRQSLTATLYHQSSTACRCSGVQPRLWRPRLAFLYGGVQVGISPRIRSAWRGKPGLPLRLLRRCLLHSCFLHVAWTLQRSYHELSWYSLSSLSSSSCSFSSSLSRSRWDCFLPRGLLRPQGSNGSQLGDPGWLFCMPGSMARSLSSDSLYPHVLVPLCLSVHCTLLGPAPGPP